MKKLLSLPIFLIIILFISASCSENTEQLSSPSPNFNSTQLSKSTEVTKNVSGQSGRLGPIGKFFDRNEANVLFGGVINSLTISVADLNAALEKGKDYILIAVKDNQVVIRDEKRGFLSRERVGMGKDEIMYKFSKSMIQNLIQKQVKQSKSTVGTNALSTNATTASDLVTVEVRASVISLSYGDATLEMAIPCPPFCAD